MREKRENLEASIEAVLAERFPEVELVDIEVRGGPAPTLTLFLDRPGGVDLELCTAVSQSLDEVRERCVLEVSSPGLDKRLRKTAHFSAVIGREVAVKLADPLDGRCNYRGLLVAVDGDTATLDLTDGGRVTLPIGGMAKAHVVYNFDTDGGQRE